MDILDDVVVVLRVVLDYLGIDIEDVVISTFEILENGKSSQNRIIYPNREDSENPNPSSN
jgi:hypothetical protein